MKKLLRILMVLFVIAGLMLSSIPGLAGPPKNAEGLWQYQPFILEVREAGCNTFMKTFEYGVWTGTFDGESEDYGKVVIHCSGAWSFKGIVLFEGSVAGRTGTFKMSVIGKKPDAAADWVGKYVILSGTGELADLRGQGAWWGPGAPAPEMWGDIYYEGSYHFKPGH